MPELKKDANADVVLNQLYKNCSLQDACCANMLALVPDSEGKLEPKLVGLKEALYYYIKHQEDVVTRRTQYDLEKDEAKKHIDEGLLIAMDYIDEIIAISSDHHVPRLRLRSACARDSAFPTNRHSISLI